MQPLTQLTHQTYCDEAPGRDGGALPGVDGRAVGVPGRPVGVPGRATGLIPPGVPGRAVGLWFTDRFVVFPALCTDQTRAVPAHTPVVWCERVTGVPDLDLDVGVSGR